MGQSPGKWMTHHHPGKGEVLHDSALFSGQGDTLLGPEELVRKVAHVVRPDERIYGRYPVSWCAAYGKADWLIALLKAKGTPNVKDEFGYTPLHQAVLCCANKNYDCVRHLLNAKAEVDHIEPHTKCTALMLAATNGKKEHLQFLIRAKADVDVVDDDGNKALDLAKKWGHLPTLRVIKANYLRVEIKAEYRKSFKSMVLDGRSKVITKELYRCMMRTGVTETMGLPKKWGLVCKAAADRGMKVVPNQPTQRKRSKPIKASELKDGKLNEQQYMKLYTQKFEFLDSKTRETLDVTGMLKLVPKAIRKIKRGNAKLEKTLEQRLSLSTDKTLMMPAWARMALEAKEAHQQRLKEKAERDAKAKQEQK